MYYHGSSSSSSWKVVAGDIELHEPSAQLGRRLLAALGVAGADIHGVPSLDIEDPRFIELVGELELYREKLVIAGTVGQVLALYHSADTRTADKLALLGSYALPAHKGEPQPGSAEEARGTVS
jgi:hypothetical protein